MPKRWQLVGPDPVIKLVVLVNFGMFPAMLEERGLNRREISLVHENIDIGRNSPFGNRQSGDEIGCAFEKNHGLR